MGSKTGAFCENTFCTNAKLHIPTQKPPVKFSCFDFKIFAHLHILLEFLTQCFINSINVNFSFGQTLCKNNQCRPCYRLTIVQSEMFEQ